MCPFRSSQAEGTDNHVKPSFAPKRTDGLTGQLKSPDTPTVLLTISQLRDCCPASRQHHQPLPPGMSRPVSLDLPGSRACPRPSHPVKTSPCTSSSLCVSELASPCQGLGQRRNPNGRDAVSRAPPPPTAPAPGNHAPTLCFHRFAHLDNAWRGTPKPRGLPRLAPSAQHCVHKGHAHTPGPHSFQQTSPWLLGNWEN